MAHVPRQTIFVPPPQCDICEFGVMLLSQEVTQRDGVKKNVVCPIKYGVFCCDKSL